MEEELQAVLEVGEAGAGGGDVPGVLSEVPPDELSDGVSEWIEEYSVCFAKKEKLN